MKFVLFYHSLYSDWNHGNAHFLRGVARDLQRRGHEVMVWEPINGWSRESLLADHGPLALADIVDTFPDLAATFYDPQTLDLDEALDGADVVIAHEWNDPALVEALGRHRAAGGDYVLLFHDTHHRSVSAPQEMAAYDLSAFDGVLAFGETVRAIYERQGWSSRAYTWHEAADITLFRPLPEMPKTGDLAWIGNWGDDERSVELREFLVEPSRRLGLMTLVHGVRYPDHAIRALKASGIDYRGWLPNHRAPEVFAAHRVTIHVPRRFYATILPGIPTIRVFEALACGIPLITAPWTDSEHLFRPGDDYLVAGDGNEMQRLLRLVLNEPAAAQSLATSGLERIRARHTCAHRVDELLAIVSEIKAVDAPDGRRTADGREVA